MLPEILTSSYERYKKDNNIFVTWLHVTATSCGHVAALPLISSNAPASNSNSTGIESSVANPPLSTIGTINNKGPRLKGKARTKARAQEKVEAEAAPKAQARLADQQGTKIVITPAELLREAETVASFGGSKRQKKIKVPLIVQRLLQETIKARKRCLCWFEEHTAKAKECEQDDLRRSNESHKHYIQVLENVYDILSVRFEACPAERAVEGATNTEKKNAFEGLEIQEINEDAYEALASVMPKINVKPDVQLEIDVEPDLGFLVYCLYVDLQGIQSFLKDLWGRVKQKERHYETAALLTNVAMEMVRRMEKALVESCPESNVGSYQCLTSKFSFIPSFHEACVARPSNKGSEEKPQLPGAWIDDESEGEPMSVVEENSVASEDDTNKYSINKDDHLYRHTYWTMDKARECINDFRRDCPAESTVATKMLLLGLPSLCRDDPTISAEEYVLNQFILELEMERGVSSFGEGKNHGGSETILAIRGAEKAWHTEPTQLKHEITDCFRECAKYPSRPLSIVQVFAGRIFLDIFHTLGSQHMKDIYLDLCSTGAMVQSMLAKVKHGKYPLTRLGTREESIPIFELWRKYIGGQNIELFGLRLACRIHVVVQNPLHMSLRNSMVKLLNLHRSKLVEKQSKLLLKQPCALPSENTSFFNDMQPTYNGLESLKLKVDMLTIGYKYEQNYFVFRAVAHIYNALKQLNLIQGSWSLLEQGMEAEMSYLFCGSYPTNIQQCQDRYEICMGKPAHLVVPGRGRTAERQNVNPRWRRVPLLPNPLICENLDRYFQGVDTGDQLLCTLSEKSKGRNDRRTGAARIETYLESLVRIEERLDTLVSALDLNMFRLAKDCEKLLLKLKAELSSVFSAIRRGNAYYEEGYALHAKPNEDLAMSILVDLSFNKVRDQIHLKKVSTGLAEARAPTWASVTVGVFQEFLDKEANVAVAVEPFHTVGWAKMGQFVYTSLDDVSLGE